MPERRHPGRRARCRRPRSAADLADHHPRRRRPGAADERRGADRHAGARAAGVRRPRRGTPATRADGRADDGLRPARSLGAADQDLQLPARRRCHGAAGTSAGHALYPLRRLRPGLPRQPAATTTAFLRPGRRARAIARPQPVRLHRMRRLRLRLPVGHSPGAVLPRVQGGDPRAAAEAAEGRTVPRAFRATPGSPAPRRGTPGRRTRPTRREGRAGARRPGRARGSRPRHGGRPGAGGDRAGQGTQAGR